MPNRLINETSPYLRQHADNPVDWYPWGTEALTRARDEAKPMLVSIGYSACHWCHVMAHESFEDRSIADLMNRHFVCIKVDREERPDVDAVYMEAVQALTGSGGWPLNVFLAPDGRPFFGGTYFPPAPAHRLPSWAQVLEGVAEMYAQRRDDVFHNAQVLTEFISRSQLQGGSGDEVDGEVLLEAYTKIVGQFDPRRGGFGDAPKFPQPLGLEFVLRIAHRQNDVSALDLLERTLHHMADGGLYDQLGGGFHRYSVDARWLVPHFEKMLYDNALLARLYTQAYAATRNLRYRRIAEETLDYVLRELRSPEGAFYSSQDADTNGVEGEFYVWSPSEFSAVLGEEQGDFAAQLFGVTSGGNFEGKSILTRTALIHEVAERHGLSLDETEARLDRVRAALFSARTKRTPPGTDHKILAGWNALCIRSLAEASRIFNRPDYMLAAQQAMRFLLTALRPNGTLTRSYLGAPGRTGAFLEDYAACVEALIALHMTAFEADYLRAAESLAREMIEQFWDGDSAAFFDTAADADQLVVRPRSLFDNPIPSGNSSATFALLRLEALTGLTLFAERAASVFRSARTLVAQAPLGVAYLLSAAEFFLSTPIQVAIAGSPHDASTLALAEAVYGRYLPNAVLSVGEPDSTPLLQGRERREGMPTAYVCERFECRVPVTSVENLTAQLIEAARQ